MFRRGKRREASGRRDSTDPQRKRRGRKRKEDKNLRGYSHLVATFWCAKGKCVRLAKVLSESPFGPNPGICGTAFAFIFGYPRASSCFTEGTIPAMIGCGADAAATHPVPSCAAGAEAGSLPGAWESLVPCAMTFTTSAKVGSLKVFRDMCRPSRTSIFLFVFDPSTWSMPSAGASPADPPRKDPLSKVTENSRAAWMASRIKETHISMSSRTVPFRRGRNSKYTTLPCSLRRTDAMSLKTSRRRSGSTKLNRVGKVLASASGPLPGTTKVRKPGFMARILPSMPAMAHGSGAALKYLEYLRFAASAPSFAGSSVGSLRSVWMLCLSLLL
mmetsp:Transcript_15046/g.57084  ORF Transcript_15046/g.57084 Transcript_15046/m.57084 type:complete len:330 (-) Transcript_15046:997-1986(-)